MLDSLVRVSRRVAWNHYASVLGNTADLDPAMPHDAKGYNSPKGDTFPRPFSGRQSRRWPSNPSSAPGRSPDDRGVPWADAKRFPFNNFTYCFTLFSKYFSSFDHSTCLLSVSCQYLALDEIYPPFCAASQNNPTLRAHDTGTTAPEPQTGFSPSLASCSKEVG